MRVAQFSEFGGPQSLRLEEVAEPVQGRATSHQGHGGWAEFLRHADLRNQYQVTPPLPVSPERRWPEHATGSAPSVTRVRHWAEGGGVHRRQWLQREGGHQGEECSSDPGQGER